MVARTSKTRPPATYPNRGDRWQGPRENFTMTDDEFMAMGGNEAPEDYDADAVEQQEYQSKPDRWSIPMVHTATVRKFKHALPAEDNVWPIIISMAHRLGVHPLTINWPDPFLPDITAVRLMEAAA